MMSRIIRMVVVLPAPLGPSSPYTEPFGTCKRQVTDRDVLVKGLSNVLNVDGGS